jgi:hypothetical protein
MTGVLFLAGILLGACSPDETEIRLTVDQSVKIGAAATEEARPTYTAYPTATVYPTGTDYALPTAVDPATAYPTATFYPIATPYPTYTPLPTDTAIATPTPRPTNDPQTSPPVNAPVAPVNIEFEILRVMIEARDVMIVLHGSAGTEVDCQSFVSNYDRLAAVPTLDLSTAHVDFQSAYHAYHDLVTKMVGPSALTDMATQCRDLLAAGQPIGHFSQEFFMAVFNEFLWGNTLTPAIKSIGGE